MILPKYKIGDCVVAKGYWFYNLYTVVGGYYNGTNWRYILRARPGFTAVMVSRNEDELICRGQDAL